MLVKNSFVFSYLILSTPLFWIFVVSQQTYASDMQSFIDAHHDEIQAAETPSLLTAAEAPVGLSFPCTVQTSPSVPTSVHKLHPSDIKVVAAVGDSVTAALGAKATSILNLINEWRGVSWSVGGDADLSSVITVPNILKQFNPSVKGFSVGKTGADAPEAGKPWWLAVALVCFCFSSSLFALVFLVHHNRNACS